MEGPERYNTIVKDKMLFEPYMNDGYRCLLSYGRKKIISVRYRGVNLMTDNEHPYEVLYPGNDGIPTGYQTARDIFRFINPNIKFEDII